jgi:hypothetical protein
MQGKNENILSSVDKTEGFWGKFKECFGSSVKDLDWVHDPFCAVRMSLPVKAQEEVID